MEGKQWKQREGIFIGTYSFPLTVQKEPYRLGLIRCKEQSQGPSGLMLAPEAPNLRCRFLVRTPKSVERQSRKACLSPRLWRQAHLPDRRQRLLTDANPR